MSDDPPFAYMYERLQAVSSQQPLTVYCALCPEWVASGTAKDALAAANKHRKDKHPEIVPKRVVRRRRSFSSAMSADREAQIEEERRQRMRALGLT